MRFLGFVGVAAAIGVALAILAYPLALVALWALFNIIYIGG